MWLPLRKVHRSRKQIRLPPGLVLNCFANPLPDHLPWFIYEHEQSEQSPEPV